MEHRTGTAASEAARYVSAPDVPTDNAAAASASASAAAATTPPASAATAATAPTAGAASGFGALARVSPGALAAAYADLCAGAWPGPEQLPLVYHPNVSARGGKLWGKLRARGVHAGWAVHWVLYGTVG